MFVLKFVPTIYDEYALQVLVCMNMRSAGVRSPEVLKMRSVENAEC